MSPRERMEERYKREHHEMPFEELVERHKSRGVVVDTPSLFLLMVPTHRSLVSGIPNRSAQPDCWFISALSGNLSEAWRHEPYPLPFYAFHRQGKYGKRLRVVKRSRLRMLTR